MLRVVAGNAKRCSLPWLLLFSLALTGCSGHEEVSANGTNQAGSILLFVGRGASRGSVAALKTILLNKHLSYSTVDSVQLNAMSEAEMNRYSLLIVPGGNFEEMGKGLNADASARVQRAVRGGLNYLGICAGAFLAGNSPFNGLNLSFGIQFGFYSAEERGIRKAAVPITFAGGSTFDHYWEDGPQLAGWGAVVAKYPDGTPAIAEGRFGQGRVILSGVHPEAPASWRGRLKFRTAAEIDNDYAVTLIKAGLTGSSLPHF